ncbi:MAG: D-erythronate dehydrogenase [Pseudomonadota bacterium]|nr:D-erythronate dehydrogenase [Pseudomonadota bacterium]
MKVVVTGGTGMIGRKLIASLLAVPELIDRDGRPAAITSITAFDVTPPDPLLPEDPRLNFVAGEISDANAIATLINDGTDAVFHLAAVVSAQAEEDFDLGMRVNLDGTRIVLERCRALDHAPRVVYASSVAAFGGEMPSVIDDDVTPNPQTTYGVTKVIGEYLIDDYSRKGFIDGRALRLPTIVVRPGRPNKAASTWASSILREPLAGHSAVCPVTEDTKMWMLSPRRVVEAFRHAQALEPKAWGPHRVVNLPGITGSVAESLEALSRAGGNSARARVEFEYDPFIQDIVNGWANTFSTPRSEAMGFHADADLDEIVSVFLEDDLKTQGVYYE